MARSGRDWNISEGSKVMTVDGENVGRIIAVEEGHLVVEEGRLFPTDHIVPIRAIADVADGAIHLSVTRDVVLERNWDTALPPVEADPTAASEDLRILGNVPVGEGGEEILRVPVHEEELVPTTEERQIGEVQLNKQVVVEERVVEVPVVEERIRITRHPVDRDPDVADDVFTEGSLAIPIRGEEIGLTTRTRVAGEVEIAKEAVQVTEQVTGTVRREEVHIETVELPADVPTGRMDDAVQDDQTLSTPAATTSGVEAVRPVDAVDATGTAKVDSGATTGSTRSAKRSKRKKR